MSSARERVIEEKEELDFKIEKLRCFIWDGNRIFEELPLVDVELLMIQHHAMKQYSEILGKRALRMG